MVYFKINFSEWIDRGFLTLPLNTLYGITAVFIYNFFPLPKRRGNVFKTVANYLIFALLATLFAGVIEYGVGMFFLNVFDIRLWYYADTANTVLNGFVNFEFLTVWFILILFIPDGLRLVFKWIDRLKYKALIATMFCFLIVIDLIFSGIYVLKTGENYDLIGLIYKLFN